jgi:NADH-quinone oxidoreductase subunit M
MAPLVAMIFIIGFFPNVFLDRMKPSIDLLSSHYRDVSGALVGITDDKSAKMLPPDVLSPKFLKGAPTFEDDADGKVALVAPPAVPAAPWPPSRRACRGPRPRRACPELAPKGGAQ